MVTLDELLEKYTIKQVAKLFNVIPRTIWAWKNGSYMGHNQNLLNELDIDFDYYEKLKELQDIRNARPRINDNVTGICDWWHHEDI